MDFLLFLVSFVGLCGWLDNWASAEPAALATEVTAEARR